MRLQELRGTYGIKAPAPICAEDETPDATCQVVQAPSSPGARLVPDVIRDSPPSLAPDPDASYGGRRPEASQAAGEIRLTYRELSALIEDAIRSLR